MLNYWKRLIVALDLDDKAKIKSVIKALAPRGVKFKIGPVAFTRFGPGLVEKIIDEKCDVFLDLKLYDIPSTMKQTAAAIAHMRCWAFTAHLSAGIEALSEVKKEVFKTARQAGTCRPLILGVTVLTSRPSTQNQVMKLAGIADKAGLDGVVASPKEAEVIKNQYSRLKVVTPGIRISGGGDDQKRVATAEFAFHHGANYIVVGRPIIEAEDYLKAAEAVLQGQ